MNSLNMSCGPCIFFDKLINLNPSIMRIVNYDIENSIWLNFSGDRTIRVFGILKLRKVGL